MRKTFCDKCGKEITTDVEWVFNHELCPECAKAVDIFITHPSRPSIVDVQPIRHGRWENEHIEDDEAWWADCTNCKNETHSKYGRVSFYAFCPNCGARMEEEQDD